MPTLRFLLLALASNLFLPVRAAQPTVEPVLIYAMAFEQKCGSESVRSYVTELSDSKRYQADARALRDRLAAQHPSCRIGGGSSRFDYGLGVREYAIARWQKKYGNCTVNVVSIKFGKASGEARSRLQIPNGVNPSIEVKYIPQVTHAR